jgi:hypothetical protein
MSVREKRANEIERLRKLAEEAFGPQHGRYDFYDYLKGVWELYLKWKADKKLKARSKQLAKFYKDKVKLRKNTHPIRAIIDASCGKGPDDKDDKSEWTRALQYLDKNLAQVQEVGFRKFIADNRGPYGCARRVARRRKGKAKAA